MTASLRRLLVPALSTAVMLAILLSLGVWQLHRLTWKQGILAEIAHAQAAPAIPLPPHPSRFQKVAVTGQFRPGLTALYADDVRETPATVQGAYLLAPLFRANHKPLLVNLGWVPDGYHKPLPSGPITLTGYIRLPDHKGFFSAKDDIPGRHFYTLNPTTIGHALNLGQVAPYTLIILSPTQPATPPFPATSLPRPPNNHFQYALTWFGLAGVLLITFLNYTWQTLRGARPK